MAANNNSTAQAPFLGVSKKVFVCVRQLKWNTSVDTIEIFCEQKLLKWCRVLSTLIDICTVGICRATLWCSLLFVFIESD